MRCVVAWPCEDTWLQLMEVEAGAGVIAEDELAALGPATWPSLGTAAGVAGALV